MRGFRVFCWCTDDEITKEATLRPLTSLKWPYVPDESAYPDPLKRDDPKPLQTRQYEAIGSQPYFVSPRATRVFMHDLT